MTTSEKWREDPFLRHAPDQDDTVRVLGDPDAMRRALARARQDGRAVLLVREAGDVRDVIEVVPNDNYARADMTGTTEQAALQFPLIDVVPPPAPGVSPHPIAFPADLMNELSLHD